MTLAAFITFTQAHDARKQRQKAEEERQERQRHQQQRARRHTLDMNDQQRLSGLANTRQPTHGSTHSHNAANTRSAACGDRMLQPLSRHSCPSTHRHATEHDNSSDASKCGEASSSGSGNKEAGSAEHEYPHSHAGREQLVAADSTQQVA